MTKVSSSRPRWQSITSWVLRVLMALAFLFAAFMKFSGNAMMVAEFDQVGLGQWFRYMTAALETVGALALLLPVSALYGALLLLVVDAGAFVAQLTRLHGDWIHTIIIGAILAVIGYLHRERLVHEDGPTRRR